MASSNLRQRLSGPFGSDFNTLPVHMTAKSKTDKRRPNQDRHKPKPKQ